VNISVCMTTYNGAQFLAEQLESIIPQLLEQDELLISDDGSTDGTIEIINKYQKKNPNLTISLYLNHFKSPVKNFEFVLGKAGKELVFLSDQDDIWYMNRVEEIKSQYRKNHNLLVLINDCEIFNNSGIQEKSFFKIRKSRAGILKNIYKNSYIGCCMVLRKELLNLALPIPKPMTMHDLWLGLVAEKYGTVKFLNKILVKYRRHDNNASEEINQSNQSLVKTMTDRVKIVYSFLYFCLSRKR